MSGGGGKGGSSKSSSQVKIPKWLEDAARANMARADKIAQIGYTPYYGPDVAAFNPTQQAAFQNTADAASAFGMAAPADPMAGMPQAQVYANGVQGYSSQPMFQQSLDAFAADRPGQFAAMSAPFIDPITGAAPGTPFGPGNGSGAASSQNPFNRMVNQFTGGNGNGGGGNGGGGYNRAQTDRDQQGYGQTGGGYTSFGDMFNGGGPGASGDTFSGGPLSGFLNGPVVRPAGSNSSSSGMGGGK